MSSDRRTGGRSARAIGDERLLERIERVHAANYHFYGYRRTWLALIAMPDMATASAASWNEGNRAAAVTTRSTTDGL